MNKINQIMCLWITTMGVAYLEYQIAKRIYRQGYVEGIKNTIMTSSNEALKCYNDMEKNIKVTTEFI